MNLSPVHVYCIADNRMQYEHFRGRSKNLLVQRGDGALEPLVWYDASRRSEKADADEYFFDPESFRVLVEQRFEERQKVHLTLLLNSFGGVMGTACLVETLANKARDSGGEVTAYASTVVQSAASLALLQAKSIHITKDTPCMWHLPAIYPHHLEELKRELPEEEFQRKMEAMNRDAHKLYRMEMRSLINRASDEHRHKIYDKVCHALERHGIRHELNVTAAELGECGIVDAVPDVQSMQRAFTERHNIPVDHQAWESDPFARFFRIAALEEAIRTQVGTPFKIALMDGRSYLLQSLESSKPPREKIIEAAKMTELALPGFTYKKRSA